MPIVVTYLLVTVLVWLICGGCAAAVGPSRYAGRVFVLTIFFMGPIGIAAALIMKTIEDYSPVSSPSDPPVRRTGTVSPVPQVNEQDDDDELLTEGDRVRVSDPGGKYDGRVGVVDEMTDENDGYNIYVAFGDDPATHAFSREELRFVASGSH